MHSRLTHETSRCSLHYSFRTYRLAVIDLADRHWSPGKRSVQLERQSIYGDNHSVEVESDVARGVVYCREEVQPLISEEWRIGMWQSWDDYLQVDGN